MYWVKPTMKLLRKTTGNCSCISKYIIAHICKGRMASSSMRFSTPKKHLISLCWYLLYATSASGYHTLWGCLLYPKTHVWFMTKFQFTKSDTLCGNDIGWLCINLHGIVLLWKALEHLCIAVNANISWITLPRRLV